MIGTWVNARCLRRTIPTNYEIYFVSNTPMIILHSAGNSLEKGKFLEHVLITSSQTINSLAVIVFMPILKIH